MCEIKQFPGRCRNEEHPKTLEENGSKVYEIKLTCAELEFIKDVLMGINEWECRIDGHFNSRHMFERGLERIHPEELADKIFEQFYDENGEYK